MPQEHHPAGTGADDADGVAGAVDLDPEATRLHLATELIDRWPLLVRQAGNRHQPLQQVDVLRRWRRGSVNPFRR